MVATPNATPVATPVLPTIAILASDVAHVPPVVVDTKAAVLPGHSTDEPVIDDTELMGVIVAVPVIGR